MSTPEGRIQLAILKKLKANSIFCWRNNNTNVYDPKLGGYRYNPSLTKGVADILGVLPDGRFLAIEVKTPKGKLSKDQALWGKRVRENGGIYIVARSVGDISSLLS
jgi:hypothetical protein